MPPQERIGLPLNCLSKKLVPGANTAYSSVFLHTGVNGFYSNIDCKSHCSVKCFSKTGYCPVRKVKDVLPSNISCPFSVLLYMANFKI